MNKSRLIKQTYFTFTVRTLISWLCTGLPIAYILLSIAASISDGRALDFARIFVALVVLAIAVTVVILYNKSLLIQRDNFILQVYQDCKNAFNLPEIQENSAKGLNKAIETFPISWKSDLEVAGIAVDVDKKYITPEVVDLFLDYVNQLAAKDTLFTVDWDGVLKGVCVCKQTPKDDPINRVNRIRLRVSGIVAAEVPNCRVPDVKFSEEFTQGLVKSFTEAEVQVNSQVTSIQKDNILDVISQEFPASDEDYTWLLQTSDDNSFTLSLSKRGSGAFTYQEREREHVAELTNTVIEVKNIGTLVRSIHILEYDKNKTSDFTVVFADKKLLRNESDFSTFTSAMIGRLRHDYPGVWKVSNKLKTENAIRFKKF